MGSEGIELVGAGTATRSAGRDSLPTLRGVGVGRVQRVTARGLHAGYQRVIISTGVLQCRRSIRGYTGQLRRDAVARGKCRHQDVRMRQGAAGLLRRCGPRVRSRMDCGGAQAVKVRAKGLRLALVACGGVDGPRGEMASLVSSEVGGRMAKPGSDPSLSCAVRLRP